MILRFSTSAVVGVFVTLLLFYIMQSLISSGEKALTDDKGLSLVDFVRVKDEQQLETKKRKPKKPPPPDEPPPDVPPQNFNVNVDQSGFSMAGVDIAVAVDVGVGGFGISDGEYLPIVKVQPQYPRRALSRGLEGYVIVEFTVNAQGAVVDPVVVANCAWVQAIRREEAECEDSPNSVFDSAARKAAAKFKYKPKVVDGNPMATSGVLNKIIFELADD